MTFEEVRSAVVKSVSRKLVDAGFDPATVRDDLDLLQEGIIDSFGFITMVEHLEDELGIEIDLASFDEDGVTTLGGFSRQVAAARA